MAIGFHGQGEITAWKQEVEAAVQQTLDLPADLLELLLSAFLTGQHVLLEGPPGSGKTTLAKILGDLHGGYGRLQMNPEVLPSDIIGTEILVSQQPLVLEFRSGPLFKRFLLVDEINRARPRTQSALLQAMSEKGVEVQGEVRPLDPDFFLLATQNPTDFDGTYLLPRSQWDRFGCVLSFCHASGDDLQRKLKLACGEPKPLSVCELTKPRWKKPEVHDEWFRICAALQSYLDGKRALGAMSLSVRAWSSWLEMGAALSCLRGQQHLSTACLRATLLPCLFHRASESRSSELAEALLLEFDRQTSGR